MGRRLIFLAAVAVVAIAGVAMSAGRGGSDEVTLCAAKQDGALALATKGKCGKGEKKLTIAKLGPPGLAGATGSPGAPGTTASIQPEAVRLVTTLGSEVPAVYCEEHPGVFCWEGPLNWINKGAGDAPVGFQKDAAGYVHLQGSAAVTGGSGPEPIAIFFLPPGYRPTDGAHIFSAPTCGVGGEVSVTTSGAVETPASCISLDGISFHP
jgi:hypothetical protein